MSARTIRPATREQADALASAIGHLRAARDALIVAKSPKTLARVRAALSSAEGAERHMSHRVRRSEDTAFAARVAALMRAGHTERGAAGIADSEGLPGLVAYCMRPRVVEVQS